MNLMNFRIPYSHGMGLISDELYESLRRSNCALDDQKSDPDSAECLHDLETFNKLTDGLNKFEILGYYCGVTMPRQRRSLSDGKRAVIVGFGETSLSAVKCRDEEHRLSAYWFNDERVLKGYHRDMEQMQQRNTKGYRSLVYSGDHDLVIPFLSTQAWIRELNYSIVDEWRPWIVEGQIAGYTRSYSNKMTFATVKGGGHTAAESRPAEGYAMFERWIADKPL
ncbi:Serine carboxypeptidase-like 17 [Heracleum sosnowskyi]|uniref:Serine carboxypeptidase-like 17 n=1 Tax=Heracleum sosnowskyi TaxID=360622 RepID=A0AAD8HGB6_9APIA|nr:Serine carboxypeptidase-like 17 [Heracleum sosnowskyi]